MIKQALKKGTSTKLKLQSQDQESLENKLWSPDEKKELRNKILSKLFSKSDTIWNSKNSQIQSVMKKQKI